MQNHIIRYVEDLKASIEPTGCSIATALAVELPKMDRLRIFKLLAAADDLQRILQLELQRREPECEQANYYGCVKCQSFHFEGDPLYQRHIMVQSKHGIQRGLRPKPEVETCPRCSWTEKPVGEPCVCEPHLFVEDGPEPSRVKYGEEDVAHCARCGQADDRPIHQVSERG